jgi:ADP-heptose:LPS heptosyltransferase
MLLPVLPENLTTCRTCDSSEALVIDGRLTRVCKHDGKPILPHANRGQCEEKKLKRPASNEAGRLFAETLVCQSGENCGICRQPEAGRAWRREQKKKFLPPNGILDFVCPYGKPWVNAAASGIVNDGRKHFLIHANQGAGDAVVMTGALRDLHLAYPDMFATAVRAGRMELYLNNPHVTPDAKVSGKVVRVAVYPGEYRPAADAGQHMAAVFRRKLGEVLGVEVPLLSPVGDIHLSEEDKAAPPEIAGPYWLAWFGGKHDFTVKHWPAAHMQKLIDLLRERVRFVRMSAHGGWHPPLEGCIDLRKQTNHRRLIRLMYHAQGGIGPVSYGMHLSAAVPTPDGRIRPFVVLAGGGETPCFYQYPGHIVMETIGRFDCCADRGCWKLKSGAEGKPEDRCLLPILEPDNHAYAKCMTMVAPEEVAAKILAAIDAPPKFPPSIDDALKAWLDAHPRQRDLRMRSGDPAWEGRGPKMWNDLHRRPYMVEALDPAAESRWMQAFSSFVPCGECRRHWEELIRRTPPNYSSRSSYFAWTVGAHNNVNMRLGKPIVTLEVARQMMESDGFFLEELT